MANAGKHIFKQKRMNEVVNELKNQSTQGEFIQTLKRTRDIPKGTSPGLKTSWQVFHEMC